MKHSLREIDALVAEHVMGRVPLKDNKPEHGKYHGECHCGFDPHLQYYSSSIEAAWSVVEKMKELGFGYCLECVETEPSPTAWFVKKKGIDARRFQSIEDMEKSSSASGPMPLAIALAALKAKGIDVEKEVE